ncbi:MAG TPA: cob(I)yrinic acid a,c-diamide adenosyltransferase [Paenibacillaceae bacterium]|nr:cob(I)yrinic acid a,c-diamide adenosyltransferase [Paenibacillaceae bacterium]
MKIYTKTGDGGDTSLLYGVRVAKTDLRVEAYGTCDEANSMIGQAVSYLPKDPMWDDVRQIIHVVQTKLFHIGAELATPAGKKVNWSITEEDVKHLEDAIDRWEESLPALTNFVLPGGSPSGASFHVARTIARRAERCAVALKKENEVNPLVMRYLNRLSDFLFVAARYVNAKQGTTEPTFHQN